MIDKTKANLAIFRLNIMSNDKEADKRLLEFGLGSVTWWGYSASCDLSSFVEKNGKFKYVHN